VRGVLNTVEVRQNTIKVIVDNLRNGHDGSNMLDANLNYEGICRMYSRIKGESD
jgi:hypothetical protein